VDDAACVVLKTSTPHTASNVIASFARIRIQQIRHVLYVRVREEGSLILIVLYV